MTYDVSLVLTAEEQEKIHLIWDSLASLGASRTEEARLFLMQSLAELVDAQNVACVGSVRLNSPPRADDPILGWRPRGIRYLRPNRVIEEFVREGERLLERGDVDETTIANVRGAGQFRVNRLRDLASPAWFEGALYKLHYLASGYHDAIWVGIPINEDAETFFGIYRDGTRPPFEEHHRNVLAHALRPLGWFMQRHMLDDGLDVAREPLTTTERRVLQGLLEGLTEKQTAFELGISTHTAHDHVKSIYRKYGVRNRSSLMALWLGSAA